MGFRACCALDPLLEQQAALVGPPPGGAWGVVFVSPSSKFIHADGPLRVWPAGSSLRSRCLLQRWRNRSRVAGRAGRGPEASGL